LHRQLLKGLALVLGKREDALQLADHRIVLGVERSVHVTFLLLQAGARVSLRYQRL
jgi:hypothetical protein